MSRGGPGPLATWHFPGGPIGPPAWRLLKLYVTCHDCVFLYCWYRMFVYIASLVKVCGCRLGLRPINCTPTLYVTQKRRCSCL